MTALRSRPPSVRAFAALLLAALVFSGAALRSLNHQVDHGHGHAPGDHVWHLLGHPHEAPDGHEHHDHSPDEHEHESDAHVPLDLPRLTRSVARLGTDAPDEVATAALVVQQFRSALQDERPALACTGRATDPPPPRWTGTGTERVLRRGHALRF